MFQHLPPKTSPSFVGKYTSTMEHMGSITFYKLITGYMWDDTFYTNIMVFEKWKDLNQFSQKNTKNRGVARPMDPPWILHPDHEPSIAAATPRQRRTVSNASPESWGNHGEMLGQKVGKFW